MPSLVPFYGGVFAPEESLRGTKNWMAAGGRRAANFLCSVRGEAFSAALMSEAAVSGERCTR